MRNSVLIFSLVCALLIAAAATMAEFMPGPQAAAESKALSAQTTQLNTVRVSAAPSAANGAQKPAVVPVAQPAKPHLTAGAIAKKILGFFNRNKPVDQVAMLISSNEGKLTTIDWNDNGHGVSVGLFQANQRVGELPQMLQTLSNDPHGHKVLASVFSPTFARKVQKDPSIVQHMQFSPNNANGKKLRKLVWMKDFQQLQVKMLRQKVVKAATIANKHGIKSEAGVAVFADITNQWGPGGAERWCRYANRYQSEGAKVKAMVQAIRECSRYGSRYQQDLKKAQCYGLTFGERFEPEG